MKFTLEENIRGALERMETEGLISPSEEEFDRMVEILVDELSD